MKIASALAAALVIAGCANSPDGPPATALAMPDRIHPPELDRDYVRTYAAQNGFRYTPFMEDIAVLSEFGYRAERERLPGFVRVWASEPRLTIDLKPSFDLSAVMAALSPDLRDRVVLREVRYLIAETRRFMDLYDTALRSIGMPEAVALFSHERDRFEITLTSEQDAARLRAAMPPELRAASVITISPSPLIVF